MQIFVRKLDNTNLSLFDFDGTISSKDSMIDFTQYAVGKLTYFFGLIQLIPTLTAYAFKLMPNHIAKEKFISYFFKGWYADRFETVTKQYSLEQLDKIIRPKAMEKIAWHKAQGHKIVIVSASIECWLKPWCDKHNIDLVATRLEIKNGKLTGKFATKNCYGIEKVNRIKEKYNLSNYNYIYAYADSKGDKEFLRLANKRYYKYFK